MSLRNVDGSPVIQLTDFGWTTYAQWQNRPGVGWVFIGYTKPVYGRVVDAVREMQSRPLGQFGWGGLLYATPGGAWRKV